MTKATLQFALDSEFPRNRVWSTARKGDKWNNALAVGDVVHLESVGGDASFGDAAVVAKEYITLDDVLANADHNHTVLTAGLEHDANRGAAKLRADLAHCYGPIAGSDLFTVLHLLPLNT